MAFDESESTIAVCLSENRLAPMDEGGRVLTRAAIGAAHGVKSSSRDWPGNRRSVNFASNAATTWGGSGRRPR